MSIDFKFSQTMSQSLALSPDLQQALKLLQFGKLELDEAVARELLENPALEEDTAEDARQAGSEAEHAVSTPPAEYDFSATATSPASSWNGEDFDRLAKVAEGETLSSHLRAQLHLLDIPADVAQAAGDMVASLDERGYLEMPLDEFCATFEHSARSAGEALEVLQSLEPAGVGARDLRECLMLQLERNGEAEGLAGRILAGGAGLVERSEWGTLADLHGVPAGEIEDAIAGLRRFTAAPGYAFLHDATAAVEPDLIFKKVGTGYVALLNENAFPALRINPSYAEVLGSLKSRCADAACIRGQLRSARWFMKCIEQRKETMLRVASALLHHQLDFLESGPRAVKPLALRDIADELEIHESTVSRAISNKYVETPWGLYALRWFFMRRIAAGGLHIATFSVKERIKALIEGESKPLSDQQIADLIKKEGITLARRTVAKYRNSLGIKTAEARALRARRGQSPSFGVNRCFG